MALKADRKDTTPLKGRFPFRLGTTSYIVPEDLVPNVEYLAPLVDDVELVLFESDTVSNLPDTKVIRRLDDLKSEYNMSYTVHLPLDIELGSADETVRNLSVGKCRRVVDLTSELDPFGYIVHFHGETRGRNPAQDIRRWQEALSRSVRDLLLSGADPGLFCVETLDYPFELVSGIVASNELSICLDVGHLVFFGYSIGQYLEKHAAKTRVIHLHGNTGGEDHKDIGLLPPGTLSELIDRLCMEDGKERVLTMEVFGYGDFVKSMDVMKERLG